ncbi:hypothetical protein NLC36_05670, partial [Candidatus Aminicenantes bacterium AC-335-L06]|nr:hypothetical protein [Candidatus Aminicenantes bacterium AC-335-L06]
LLEIKDEYDEETEAIINETSGSFLVKGDTEIKELEEIFQVELEDREYNTIGGLITHTLNRLPVKGEIVNVKGLEIEILDVDEKRIRRVRIKKSDKNQGNKNEREEI